MIGSGKSPRRCSTPERTQSSVTGRTSRNRSNGSTANPSSTRSAISCSTNRIRRSPAASSRRSPWHRTAWGRWDSRSKRRTACRDYGRAHIEYNYYSLRRAYHAHLRFFPLPPRIAGCFFLLDFYTFPIRFHRRGYRIARQHDGRHPRHRDGI